MHFEPNEVYHVYNRGNNKQLIFFQDRNYLFLLNKVRTEWKKYCEILNYCLMPNHFHFMLIPNEDACKAVVMSEKVTNLQYLSKQIGHTLSSYTKAINVQNDTAGNLFQKKTKAKCLKEDFIINKNSNSIDYITTCFHYIHQNPLKANLVNDLKDWKYSSWPDYTGLRKGSFCNQEKLFQLTGLSKYNCVDQNILNEKVIENIF